MEIINTLMRVQGAALVSSLLRLGFDNKNADTFLHEAGSRFAAALTSGQIELNQGSSASHAHDIIGAIDAAALATSAGIDDELARKGLGVLVPQLLHLLQQQLSNGQSLTALLSGGNTPKSTNKDR